MKFDYVIGNPPYQLETEKKSETNGQTRSRNIFHYFQIEADKIANESAVLIYPGGRWIQRSGKGMNEFGFNQINDKKLKDIYFYPNSKDLFTSAAIGDGLSIVVKNQRKNDKGFSYFYCENGLQQKVEMLNPGDNIIPLNPNDIIITRKIEDFVKEHNLKYLHDRVHTQKLFGIESNFVSENKESVREYIEGMEFNKKTEVKIYANDKAGKAGRTKWYIINRDMITTNSEYIDKWKVVVSSANAGGQKRNNQLEIIDNYSAFGRSRVALASFDTEDEAINFYKYIKSYVIKYAFLLTDEALTTLALKVPDINNYYKNELIDFEKDVDEQLINLLNLTKEEVNYIKNRINSLRSKEVENDG